MSFKNNQLRDQLLKITSKKEKPEVIKAEEMDHDRALMILETRDGFWPPPGKW